MRDLISKNGQQVRKAPNIDLCTVTYVGRVRRLYPQVQVYTQANSQNTHVTCYMILNEATHTGLYFNKINGYKMRIRPKIKVA